jgi:hypothetical protein
LVRTSWRARVRCSSLPLEHQAVDALAAGAPSEQAALHLGALEACALGEPARRQQAAVPPNRRGFNLSECHKFQLNR